MARGQSLVIDQVVGFCSSTKILLTRPHFQRSATSSRRWDLKTWSWEIKFVLWSLAFCNINENPGTFSVMPADTRTEKRSWH